MKNSYFKIYLIAIVAFSLSACLQEKEQKSSGNSTTSWFEGIVSAKNLGGYPSAIKLTWNAANRPISGYSIYSLEYNSDSKSNKWTKIEDVNPDVTSYTHSDLTAGQIYSYMVRAKDQDEVEDSNSKQASTVAFDGISTAKTTGKTTATVTLNTATGAFNEVRVYAQPSRGGTKKLVATAKGSVDTVLVTGLRSGVKYKFSVAAYMDYLAAEDGNEVYIEAQTPSESFGTGGLADTDYAYRGMISVQAFGDAPHAPTAPKNRLVKLTWLAFNNANSATKYRVFRTSTANNLDTTTTTACAASLSTSCVVNCSNSGSGAQTCEDPDVAAPPANYYYTVALVKHDEAANEDWVEELPVTSAVDFYTKVSIPSDNMVLVQRDAANYEMCNLMGATPNPRKHQRCPYTGIAGVPYSSGPGKPLLNLDSGYYDFGYNLFVDRFRVACNWTRNSPTCGPNGCIGITGSTGVAGTPSGTLGNVGDTFFALNYSYGSNCYYKTSGGWTLVPNLTDPAQLRSAVTVDPGIDGDKRNPQMNGMDPAGALRICNAQTTAYGSKRLMRRREYIHAAAFASLPGEPNALVDKVEESNLRLGVYSSVTNAGGQMPGYQRCASASESSLLIMPTTLAELLAPTNMRSQINVPSPVLNIMSRPYFIGTSATANCVSRWGAQDPISTNMMDGANTVFSDSFVRTNDFSINPPLISPVTSDYDSGVYYDWFNSSLTYAFDNISGPALGDASNWFKDQEMNSSVLSNYQSYIVPMGLPLIPLRTPYRTMTNVIYNGTMGSSAFGSGNNAMTRVVYANGSLTYPGTTRFIMIEGRQNRFSYTLHPDQTTSRFGAWCALEAE